MKKFTLLFLVFFFISHQVLTTNGKAESPLVPAVYFFGDSGMDVGNNNYLQTAANVSRWPSGVDLNNQTGRFSNGKTIADFFAIDLGLPMAPAYLSLNESTRSKTTTGINYASGSCGILSSTGAPGCLTLHQQIEYFTSTVKQDLPKAITSKEELKRHISKSIYILIIGGNDFSSFVSPTLVHLNKTLNPGHLGGIPSIVMQKMTHILLEHLTHHLKTLYHLGARKFLVSDNYGGFALQERVKIFSGSIFTFFDSHNIAVDVKTHPAKFAFKNVNDACYNEKLNFLCDNRREYMMWDMVHTTEAANEIGGNDCFTNAYGGNTCKPLTLEQLAQAP